MPPRPKAQEHGVWAYSYGRCRCEECRTAWREYRRDRVRAYRTRKREEQAARDG